MRREKGLRGSTGWASALGGLALACNGDMRAYFDADVVNTEEDVSYVDGSDNPRQMLDLYLPRGVVDYPVCVFIHGGYWIGQDKDYYAPVLGLYGNVGRALAKRGVGVAVINYRLVPDVTFAEQLSDVVSAVRWTAAQIPRYGGDAERLFVAGHSAGGHLTALLAQDDRYLSAAGVSVRGFAPLSAIFDLSDMAEHPPDSGFNARVTRVVFGDDLTTYSPRTYFRPLNVPLFVAMGERDEPYLVQQIPKAVAELRALGNRVEFTTLARHSHADVVLNFDSNDDELSKPLADFIFNRD